MVLCHSVWWSEAPWPLTRYWSLCLPSSVCSLESSGGLACLEDSRLCLSFYFFPLREPNERLSVGVSQRFHLAFSECSMLSAETGGVKGPALGTFQLNKRRHHLGCGRRFTAAGVHPRDSFFYLSASRSSLTIRLDSWIALGQSQAG